MRYMRQRGRVGESVCMSWFVRDGHHGSKVVCMCASKSSICSSGPFLPCLIGKVDGELVSMVLAAERVSSVVRCSCTEKSCIVRRVPVTVATMMRPISILKADVCLILRAFWGKKHTHRAGQWEMMQQGSGHHVSRGLDCHVSSAFYLPAGNPRSFVRVVWRALAQKAVRSRSDL